MKKSTTGIKKILMLGAISPEGWHDELCATPADCEAVAKRLQLPGVTSLRASVRVDWDKDIIRVSGHLWATLTRECVVSLELFPENIDTNFEALFSENTDILSKETEMKEAIDPVDRGRLDFLDILTEQVGLNMDPFPHKPDISYNDSIFEIKSENKPFSNLKNMIKKD